MEETNQKCEYTGFFLVFAQSQQETCTFYRVHWRMASNKSPSFTNFNGRIICRLCSRIFWRRDRHLLQFPNLIFCPLASTTWAFKPGPPFTTADLLVIICMGQHLCDLFLRSKWGICDLSINKSFKNRLHLSTNGEKSTNLSDFKSTNTFSVRNQIWWYTKVAYWKLKWNSDTLIIIWRFLWVESKRIYIL